MRNPIPVLSLMFMLMLASEAQAQLNRAYVSAEIGSDANACSFAAPCRTFGQAVSVLNAGGEIIVRHGGGFGSFTIDRSLKIQAPPSVFAGVISASGNGILINAASDARVVITGVTLTGVGALRGVRVSSAGEVHLENMVIDGFGFAGADVETLDRLHMKDVIVRGNENGVIGNPDVEMFAMDSSFDANVSDGVWTEGNSIFARCSFDDNGRIGFVVVSADAVMTDSIASGNLIRGVNATSSARLMLERVTVSDNGQGIVSAAGAVISVANSTISYNDFGLSLSSTITSRGDNSVVGNAGGSTFSSTFAPQ